MLEEPTTIENLERIESSIHELLSYDWKIDSKAEHLLKILGDLVKLKTKIKIQQLGKEPSDKEILSSTIKDLQIQKENFISAQKYLDQSEQALNQNGETVIKSISTLLFSFYDIKQLEYLIMTNQNSEKVVQMLEKIRNELNYKIKTEEQNIEQADQGYNKQQKLLKLIEEQVMEKVELKAQQSQALTYEAQKGLSLEKEQRNQYIEALEIQNDLKIKRIQSFEDEYSPSISSVKQNQSVSPKTPEIQANTKLKFEVIKLEASYQYEKMVGVTLFLLTLVLLAYFIIS